MKYRKGLGPAAVIGMIVGLSMTFGGVAIIFSGIDGLAGETAADKDEDALSSIKSQAENKCNDASSGSETQAEQAIEGEIEIEEYEQMVYSSDEEKLILEGDDIPNEESDSMSSSSCDYSIDNTIANSQSIEQGVWEYRIVAENTDEDVVDIIIRVDG